MIIFSINNDKWTIEEKGKDELKELYEKETQEKNIFRIWSYNKIKTYYLYKQGYV